MAPSPIIIPAAIVIYLLSGPAEMTSSLPGGIGVNKSAMVLLLSQQGVSTEVALPVAGFRRLITPWPIVLLAVMASVIIPQEANADSYSKDLNFLKARSPALRGC